MLGLHCFGIYVCYVAVVRWDWVVIEGDCTGMKGNIFDIFLCWVGELYLSLDVRSSRRET